jgi:hypothetical protein
LRSAAQSGESTIEYKLNARKTIVDAGYRIILNVGDQFSDLNGSPAAEFSFKPSNPFYSIPEVANEWANGAIRPFIQHHNKDPKPFIWHKTADQFLASVP